MFPQAAMVAGWSFADLITTIISMTLSAPAAHPHGVAGDPGCFSPADPGSRFGCARTSISLSAAFRPPYEGIAADE
jgi:hypothetical protein